MESFEPASGSVTLSSVRAGILVDTSVEARGEYSVRATLQPEGAREPGWTAGLVVAGAPERATTMVGLDDRGLAGIWVLNAAPRGTATFRRARTIALTPAVADGEAIELAVRVLADGSMRIRVGDRPELDARLDPAPDGARHVGVFARNAHVRFVDPVLELAP